ncbi:hypothetical protein P154DRAFT_496497 [Amniculicola lignicola CBS 123094]|uniref:CAP-Gly domain-containing protein n=1 Tax=Amniculicola lignicola CBS 123094 TaxID=1392246 RepID=A0A6A5W8M5_9PLEO|nr:hypothetical protein P154DRAFT_496497 [Amniculicola lignicola CBS 123094]
MTEFRVGQTIETTDGRQGLVKYVGEIHVAPDEFLGIELSSPTGKNDGSVQGERLTRPTATPTKAPTPAPRARPSSIGGFKAPTKPPTTSNRLSIASPSALTSARTAPRKSSISGVSAISATGRVRSTPPSVSKPLSSTSTTTAKSAARDTSGTDALETKIRHLEKQHNEDREKVKKLEQVTQERDRFEGIIAKLQGKCQAFHGENAELREQLKQSETELEKLSRNEAEHESILELATLDREMAEERAEAAEAEAESLKQRLEEQELEMDILRSEAELFTENMTDEDKEQAGYYRLEKERDRLRQALLILKEMTEQTEADLNDRIQELEEETIGLDTLREERAQLQDLVVTSEATIEDLRQQLDAATSWEEMIEDLSDQNQRIKDQLAEKDMVIKDLENLKELNDELEIHHIEQANELRAELDIRESELAEQTRKVFQQDAAITDQDSMITKFRDLVLELQSKMADAESSKTMTEEQAKDVTGRFNEVMELNRRLRNATLTTTVKTITSELQKLQAEEAEEELDIVKHYLPDSPEIYKNDSLRSYFRAKRVSFKSSLVCSLMKGLSLQSGSEDDVDRPINDLLRFDIIHQLTYLSLRSEQFRSAVASSSLEQFVAFGPANEELDPIEKTLERCLDALKKDEVNYKDLSDSLRRSNQILDGVMSDYKDAVAARPEDEIVFRASSIKSNFEMIKTTFDSVKSLGQTADNTEVDTDDDSEEDTARDVLERLRGPIDTCSESIVAAGKLIRTLHNLRDDSLYPRLPMGIEDITQQDELLGRTARAAHRFATDLARFLISSRTTDNDSVPASDLAKEMESLRKQHFPNNELVDITGVVAKINFWIDYASVLMNNVEIEHGPAPWVLKANEIEAAKKQTADAEKKLQSLTAEHHATMLQIREREEIIDTKELEIEHLKAKHREAVTKVEEKERLEKELRQAEQERAKFQQEVKAQQAEIQRLKERTALSERSEPTQAQPMSPSGATNPAVDKMEAQRISGSFAIFVQALTNENHWLRKRENHEMFGSNMRALFTKMRDAESVKAKRDARLLQQKADKMLDLCMNLERSEFLPTTIEPPMKHKKNSNSASSFRGVSARRGRVPNTPFLLTPAKGGLTEKRDEMYAYGKYGCYGWDELEFLADEWDDVYTYELGSGLEGGEGEI